MLRKMVATGFNLATLPARLTWRSARAMAMTPAQFQAFTDELRQASDAAARELQAVLAGVDEDMSRRAGHLSAEQKQQAAMLAIDAAEKHLSMAAIDMLRAAWLTVHAHRELEDRSRGVIIDQDH